MDGELPPAQDPRAQAVQECNQLLLLAGDREYQHRKLIEQVFRRVAELEALIKKDAQEVMAPVVAQE